MKKALKKKVVKKKATKAKKAVKGRLTIADRLKKNMAILRKASNAKIRELETELNRLREENEYKNKQLASKDMEMESYKKTMDEKVFQLEAKVKELGG